MTPKQIEQLNKFFKTTFRNSDLRVVRHARKGDSAEVYLGEEFLGLVYQDTDEGELSYNFSMAILDIDLQ